MAVEWDGTAVGFEIHVRFNPTVDRAASRANGPQRSSFLPRRNILYVCMYVCISVYVDKCCTSNIKANISIEAVQFDGANPGKAAAAIKLIGGSTDELLVERCGRVQYVCSCIRGRSAAGRGGGRGGGDGAEEAAGGRQRQVAAGQLSLSADGACGRRRTGS